MKTYTKASFAFLLFSMIFGLAFQNCGNSYEAYEEDVLASETPLGFDNIRLIYRERLEVAKSGRQYTFTLVEVGAETPYLELRVITAMRGLEGFSFQNPVLNSFQKYPPKVVHKPDQVVDDPVHLAFLSDDEQSMALLQINPDDSVQIVWQLNLPTPLPYQDFLYEMVDAETDGRFYITTNTHILHATDSTNPTIEACDQANYSIVTDQCVPDVRACMIANGSGQQTWNGTAWSACTAINCLPTFHLANNQCDPDVIACTDNSPGAIGTITWNGNAYGPCVINSCSQPGYHLENGTCLPDARECNVANGMGLEIWNGNAYDACTAESCNTNYQLSQTTPATCEPILDGSMVRYVQANQMSLNQMRNACNNLGFPMQPVGCLSGEAREPAAQGIINYVYGTYGGYNSAGNVLINGTFCYRPGQKRDNDGTDRVVGIKCSNVPTSTLNFQ